MPERVSIDKAQFEAFVAENQALVERSTILLQKIDGLEKLNRDLGEELKRTKERLNSVEANLNADEKQTSKTLREARERIAQLMMETEKRVAR